MAHVCLDVFALPCILVEMLSEMPFSANIRGSLDLETRYAMYAIFGGIGQKPVYGPPTGGSEMAACAIYCSFGLGCWNGLVTSYFTFDM